MHSVCVVLFPRQTLDCRALGELARVGVKVAEQQVGDDAAALCVAVPAVAGNDVLRRLYIVHRRVFSAGNYRAQTFHAVSSFAGA